MSNNILKELNISVKILILFFLICMLFITSSIYFVLFELVLTIVLIILSEENIKKYTNSIRLFLVLVVLVLLSYFLFRNNILILSTKIFVSVLLLNILVVTTSFLGLYNGIYTLLKIYYRNERILNLRVLNLCTKIYFFNRLFINNERMDKLKSKGITKKHILNYIKIKYNLSKIDAEFVKNKLKLKIYSGKFEKINRKSKLFLCLTIILAIIVVLKEVI